MAKQGFAALRGKMQQMAAARAPAPKHAKGTLGKVGAKMREMRKGISQGGTRTVGKGAGGTFGAFKKAMQQF